jgi:hypothetical protein
LAAHFIVAMVGVVSALRSFDLVATMTRGGPYESRLCFRGNLIVLARVIGGNLVPFQILAIPLRPMIDGFGLSAFHCWPDARAVE